MPHRRRAPPLPTLLVVEDDPTINQAVTDRLVAEGFRVVQAFDGPGAVAAHGEHAPDLVVLDLMLPGFDGLEVCRRIQAERPVPVLMLTARADETDLLVGLGVGADDYVTKPFRMREVVARIRALLRRVERARELAAEQPPVLAVGDLTVDRGSRRVSARGSEVHLTPLEFDLLLALAAEPGRGAWARRADARGVGLGRRRRHPHPRQPREVAARQDRRRPRPHRPRRRLRARGRPGRTPTTDADDADDPGQP